MDPVELCEYFIKAPAPAPPALRCPGAFGAGAPPFRRPVGGHNTHTPDTRSHRTGRHHTEQEREQHCAGAAPRAAWGLPPPRPPPGGAAPPGPLAHGGYRPPFPRPGGKPPGPPPQPVPGCLTTGPPSHPCPWPGSRSVHRARGIGAGAPRRMRLAHAALGRRSRRATRAARADTRTRLRPFTDPRTCSSASGRRRPKPVLNWAPNSPPAAGPPGEKQPEAPAASAL
jgi:hypothetical protein